jgi:hypothetical protein
MWLRDVWRRWAFRAETSFGRSPGAFTWNLQAQRKLTSPPPPPLFVHPLIHHRLPRSLLCSALIISSFQYLRKQRLLLHDRRGDGLWQCGREGDQRAVPPGRLLCFSASRTAADCTLGRQRTRKLHRPKLQPRDRKLAAARHARRDTYLSHRRRGSAR